MERTKPRRILARHIGRILQIVQSFIQSYQKSESAYRVGGLATAGAAWVSKMIAYCKQNNVPIDFISTHTYGVKQGFLDKFGRGGTVLSKDKNAVSGDVINSRKQIESSFKPNLE